MKRYRNETFDFTDADSGAIFSDIEFSNCYFEGCAISIAQEPRLRTTIRNVKLSNCSQRGCTIFSAIIEDSVVDGLDTRGQLLQCWGAVFKHVVLRGKVGEIMTSHLVDLLKEQPHKQVAFDSANEKYYRNVDWALDISKAEAQWLELRGVPARLIRRDPETQVIVTREAALRVPWSEMSLKDTLWKTALKVFLDHRLPDMVFVAPKRHRKFDSLLADLRTLQAAGVAEPD